MARILVVGSTGQLGGEVVRQAAGLGRHRVRALVRTGSAHNHLPTLGAELRFGDLKDKASLLRACNGIDAVVATATVVFPRGKYSFDQDERIGYRNLVEACVESGVSHVIFISLAVPFEKEFLEACPTCRMKLACEELLRAAPFRHTIFRCTPFMDDYFALIGSRIPLRGVPRSTLSRATGVTRVIRQLVGGSIDSLGVALVPGPASTRHAFIAVADVGAFVLTRLSPQPKRGMMGAVSLCPAGGFIGDVACLKETKASRSASRFTLPDWLFPQSGWKKPAKIAGE